MLLPDRVRPSSVEPFDFFTISCLERAKNTNVARLELVGGVRGESTEDDIILVTELHQFEGLVCAKSIVYQYPRSIVRSSFSLWIKNLLNLVYVLLLSEGIVCSGSRLAPNGYEPIR